MNHTSERQPAKSQYDLVVIGSGPGGQRAAVQAAKLGKSVLVIEKERIGGSCLHTGTIPSKALREAALRFQGHNAVQAAMDSTHRVVEEESRIIQAQLDRNKVEFIAGVGSIEAEHKICIRNSKGTFVVESQFIVLATGTRPRRQNDLPFNKDSVFDSDTILSMNIQPKTMLVIGAGVIGCEYASIFAHTGVKVTLLDRRQELLRSIDQEVVVSLRKQFDQEKIETLLGYDFKDVKPVLGEKTGVKLTLKAHDGKEETRTFDSLLYCMGRVGNVEALNLSKVGIKTDERGLIVVNKNYQTNFSTIYAVGDIIGHPALAASSSEQGRLAALHALKGEEAQFPETFPYGIYTIPEISSVGAQEEDLKRAGVSYVVGRALYRELARGKMINDEHGFLKILVDTKTEKILGVHVIGTGATELVHIGQTAMAFGGTIHFFVKNVFNYPTLAEAYKVAAYAAVNQLQGLKQNSK